MPQLPAFAVDRPIRLAVLLSGGGTTMQNLAQRIADGRLPNCFIAAVIASNDTCAGIERAKDLGLPCQVVRRKDFDKGAAGVVAFSDVVFGHARDAQADLISTPRHGPNDDLGIGVSCLEQRLEVPTA